MKKVFDPDFCKHPERFLLFFLIFSAVMWFLIPVFSCEGLHFDPAETMMWGSTFNQGGAKHPPMSGWILYNFSKLFAFRHFSIFIPGQLCMLFGLLYIYKLSRCFFDRTRSVMAALLITFYFIYNYETTKFNANMPHLFFIPMMCYHFYRGVKSRKLLHWLLLAAAWAGAALTKYYAAVLAVPFLIYILSSPENRKCLTGPQPYLAALLFFVLMTPHFIHLYQTDFLVFGYVGGEKQYSYFVQLAVITGAIIAPLAAMAFAALLIWCIGRGKLPPFRVAVVDKEAFFYSGILLGSQAAVILLMALAGCRVETMWTYQLYFTAGIFIMSFFPAVVPERTFKVFMVLVSAFAVLMMGIDLVYSNVRSNYRRHLDMAELRAKAVEVYGSGNIPLITGDIWHAAILQNAFSYRIPACPVEDPLLSGLHRETFRQQGALIVTASPAGCEKYLRENNCTPPAVWYKYSIPFRARFGKPRTHTVHLAIIPPQTNFLCPEK